MGEEEARPLTWSMLCSELDLEFDQDRVVVAKQRGKQSLSTQATRILRALADAPEDSRALSAEQLIDAGEIAAKSTLSPSTPEWKESARKQLSDCIKRKIDPFLRGTSFEIATLGDGSRKLRRRSGSTARTIERAATAPTPPSRLPAPSGGIRRLADRLSDGQSIRFVLGSGLSRPKGAGPRVVDALGVAECAAAVARRSSGSSITSSLDVDIDFDHSPPTGHLVVIGSPEVNVVAARVIAHWRGTFEFAEWTTSPPGMAGLSSAGVQRSQEHQGVYCGMIQVFPNPWAKEGVVVLSHGIGHAGTVAATLLLDRILAGSPPEFTAVDEGRSVCFLVRTRVKLRGTDAQDPGRLGDRFVTQLPISDPLDADAFEFLE